MVTVTSDCGIIPVASTEIDLPVTGEPISISRVMFKTGPLWRFSNRDSMDLVCVPSSLSCEKVVSSSDSEGCSSGSSGVYASSVSGDVSSGVVICCMTVSSIESAPGSGVGSGAGVGAGVEACTCVGDGVGVG